MKHVRFFIALMLFSLMFCPAISLAASTAHGNPWDDMIDTSPFTGTKFVGTVSIYLAPNGGATNHCPTTALGRECYPFMTIRLSKGSQLYSFQEVLGPVCENSSGEIKNASKIFIGDALSDIFGTNLIAWSIKDISNLTFDSEPVSNSGLGSIGIVADIQLAVQLK
jgi:hypothetical protein